MIAGIDQLVPLSDGNELPGFGFGCYKACGEELASAIHDALDCGYILFDTASYYRNEDVVGVAIANYGKDSHVYIVSKIWPTEFGNISQAVETCLKKIGRDAIDALLLHWPGTDKTLRLKAWKELSGQREKGRVRSIGASNFLKEHLVELHEYFGEWPAINQIESHPYFPQNDLTGFCQDRGMAVMAWSPLGRGMEMDNPVIKGISAEHGVSPARIILRWHIQHDRIPIPKSVHAGRIRENSEIFDFSLTPSQMDAIDLLAREDGRRGADPRVFP